MISRSRFLSQMDIRFPIVQELNESRGIGRSSLTGRSQRSTPLILLSRNIKMAVFDASKTKYSRKPALVNLSFWFPLICQRHDAIL